MIKCICDWVNDFFNKVISKPFALYKKGAKWDQYSDPTYQLPSVMREAFVAYVEEKLTFSITDAGPSYNDCIEELKWREEISNFPDAVDTYVYLKVRRNELVELEQRLLRLLYDDNEDEEYKKIYDYSKSAGYRKLDETQRKVEEHLHYMDQRYLHRIVKLAPHLWG